MPATIAFLLPVLRHLAMPAASAVVAGGILRVLRARYGHRSAAHTRLTSLLAAVLCARSTALVLSGLIAIASAAIVAWLMQEDLLLAVDTALAAALAAAVNQLVHGETARRTARRKHRIANEVFSN